MDQFNNAYGFYNQPNNFWQGQSVNVDTRSFCQTLTEDEIKALTQAQDEFTLGITKEEQLRAICMHRDLQGHSMLDTTSNILGEAKCKICGETFNIVDSCTDQDIEDAVNNLLDVLQTTKTLYVDMPVEAARKFYTIIAMLKKVPALYKIASENFTKHENAIIGWRLGHNTPNNGYQAIYSGFFGMNPAMYGMNPGMAPNPAFGGQPNPYYAANPMGYGAPIPPQNQGNPFGTNGAPVAPAPYSPSIQGFQYAAPPTPPVAPVAPVAPQAEAAAPVETVTVDTAFKA